MRRTPLAFALVLWLACRALAVGVTDLRCEYRTNPLGVDEPSPRLTWALASDRRGESQIAYRVVVASSRDALAQDRGDVLDTGRVDSDQTAYVFGTGGAGATLAARARCYWKVKVWSRDAGGADEASPWSDAASWTMGLPGPGDWSARWVTASRWFTPPGVRHKGLIVSSGGWADVDLGSAARIDSVKLYPFKPELFPVRFRVETSAEPQFARPTVVVDRTAEPTRVSSADALAFATPGAAARFVRLVVTEAPPNAKAVVRQMEVYSGGENVARMKFTREHGTAWDRGHAAFLVDGMPSQGEGDVCPAGACPTVAAPLLRRAFDLDRPVRAATLSVAALGMADVTINGQKVGDEVLGPPFTDATKRVLYVTRDVTPLLRPGANAIGATLGNGFFSTPGGGFGERQGGDGPPRLLAQLDVDFADGTHAAIGTDSKWKWSTGEVTYNDVWAGYAEDRRLAKPGWDRAGYDDAGWSPVAVTDALGGAPRAAAAPPIRPAGEVRPVRVGKDHAYFDVQTTGWPRVKVNGKAGQTITLTGPHFPRLSFTLAADGPAVLEPRFVYLAPPQDLQVLGLDAPLSADDVTIRLARADVKPAGAFTCSNAFLNRVYAMLVRTHLNYLGDQPMDPSREKQGWTQDAQNMFETAAYLSDVPTYYGKWWQDFADGQEESGYLGSVLPVVGRQVSDWNGPWWSGAIVLLPWQHYQYYGDRRVLGRAYGPMCRYVDFLGKMADAGAGTAWGDYPYLNVGLDAAAARERMLIWNGAGDWENPYSNSQRVVPPPMTTMPAWYYYATIVSRTAALLGRDADAARYAAVAEDVRGRFNEKYFHPDTGMYGDAPDVQTATVLPLAVGMVPDDKRDLTYRRLLDAIHARRDHVGTGFVALPFLLQTLTERRETALANRMVNRQDYPGWNTLGHDGILGEGWHGGGAQMPSTGGAIGMWMYQSALGIRPDPAGPGFAKFVLAPQPDPATGLTSASGYYDCVHGRIGSDWACDAGRFTLRTAVPPNTEATLYLPTDDAGSVTESGGPAADAVGVRFLRSESHAAVYNVRSGRYVFSCKMP